MSLYNLFQFKDRKHKYKNPTLSPTLCLSITGTTCINILCSRVPRTRSSPNTSR